MDAMSRKPFLSHETTRHGRLVWYFKRNGKRIRLPDPYGSEAFNEAYERALRGDDSTPDSLPKTTTESLRWLVEQYKRSSDYALLSARTRRDRDYIFDNLLEKNGDKAYKSVTRTTIKSAMDKKVSTPAAANEFLKALRGLFKWATEEGKHLEANPTAGIALFETDSDGHHAWTMEEVDQYRKHHKLGTKARLAIDMLLFLGLRRSDVILVGKQHVKEGIMSLRTGKTKTWVHLPIFKQLQESLDKTPTGDLAFLTSATGEPFATGDSFGHWFKKRVLEANLPDHCTAHGLRKAGATIAAEEGATAHELMAMFGWSRLAMAELYTQEASKKRLARSASTLVANRMKTKVGRT